MTAPDQSIPDLLHSLAAIARGQVSDRGERHAAAQQGEAAAQQLVSLLSEMESGVRTLEELAGAGLADVGQVKRLRCDKRGDRQGLIAARPCRV